MPTAPSARRDAFASFVTRALDQARLTRNWSVPQVAEETERVAQEQAKERGERDWQKRRGVANSTLYRWMGREWTSSPNPDQVALFCDTLGIPRSAAWSILWPDLDQRPAVTGPLPVDPDLEILLRRLVDPSVSDQEKFHIRETLAGLAARPVRKSRRTAG